MAVSAQTDLGRKIEKYIRHQVGKVVDRRRVASVRDDGLVETSSHDPDLIGADAVPMRQLRHVRAAAGDDVVTLRLGGKDVIIGAIGGQEDTGEAPLVADGSGGQQVIPIAFGRSIDVQGPNADTWYTQVHEEIELPGGEWELNLVYQANIWRSVNSGRIAAGIRIVGEYTYQSNIGQAAFGSNTRNLTEPQYMSVVCRHRVAGGGPVIIAGMCQGYQTSGAVRASMGTITGTAIRVS